MTDWNSKEDNLFYYKLSVYVDKFGYLVLKRVKNPKVVKCKSCDKRNLGKNYCDDKDECKRRKTKQNQFIEQKCCSCKKKFLLRIERYLNSHYGKFECGPCAEETYDIFATCGAYGYY